MNLYEEIFDRQSIRKFTAEKLPENMRKLILAYVQKTARLDESIGIEIEILDKDDENFKIVGMRNVNAPQYLLMYSEEKPGYEQNAGYVFEQLILYLAAKNLGSCYLGMAKPRSGEKNGRKYVMMAAIGYTEADIHRDSQLAKRIPLNKLCSFKEEPDEQVKFILRAARLAPSAVNAQNWRFQVFNNKIHVFSTNPTLLQKATAGFNNFNIGIAMSHMALAAEEQWLEYKWEKDEVISSRTLKNLTYQMTLAFK